MSREELLRWAFERLGVADRAPARIAARGDDDDDDSGESSASGDDDSQDQQDDAPRRVDFDAVDLWQWVLYYLAKEGMLQHPLGPGVTSAFDRSPRRRALPTPASALSCGTTRARAASTSAAFCCSWAHTGL